MRKIKGDEIIKTVNLGQYPPELVEAPVKRTFGQYDMYKDNSKFSLKEQKFMEEKLSAIEGHASRIIARVVDAHKAGKEGIWLSRPDKDLLRKFLFVMKYRSPIFFRRFNHKTAEEYSSNDRTEFLSYMRATNKERPLDVWFDNLLQIIDKPMDPAGHWITELKGSMYPGDADWLFINIRTMYLAFVTPADTQEEFILTENAFNIHEGPVSTSVDRITGKQTITVYTEYHLLHAISPQLALVLRHTLLPEPLEDLDPELRDQRKFMLALEATVHTDPEHAKTSMLHDLPIGKARNSYTTVESGRLSLANGADWKPRSWDKFYFLFFRLESRHTQLINTVMLDQAHCISTLVYRSDSALRRALEFYLGLPAMDRGVYSIKTISDRPDDVMLLLFRKLEYVAHLLGSDVKARYDVDPLMDDCDVINKAVASTIQGLRIVPVGNPLALAMVVLKEALAKTEFGVPTMHTLDLTLAHHGRRPYPDLVSKAVKKTCTSSENPDIKALLDVVPETWRLAWRKVVDEYLSLSADSQQRAKSTGSQGGVQYTAPPNFSKDDDPVALVDDNDETLDEAVASVLNSPELATQNEPMYIVGLVMIKVLIRMEIDVKTAHILDILSESDGQPPYPDCVFEAVQMADSSNFNLYTRKLPTVHLDYWQMMWKQFVTKALENSKSNLQDDVEYMRQALAEDGDECSSKDISAPTCDKPWLRNGIYKQQDPEMHIDGLVQSPQQSVDEIADIVLCKSDAYDSISIDPNSFFKSRTDGNVHERNHDLLHVPLRSRLSRSQSSATDHRFKTSSPSWLASLMVPSLVFFVWYWWFSTSGK
jgi:hypothetical protein